MKVDHANDWWPAIADAIEEGFIAIDEHDHIVGYNKATLQTLQATPVPIGAPAFWHSSFMQPIAAIVCKRKTLEGTEVRLERPGGSYTWLRLKGKPLITDKATGYIVTFTDITRWIDNLGVPGGVQNDSDRWLIPFLHFADDRCIRTEETDHRGTQKENRIACYFC